MELITMTGAVKGEAITCRACETVDQGTVAGQFPIVIAFLDGGSLQWYSCALIVKGVG